MSVVSRTEVVHAYRALYRTALRAVQFSKPARDLVRDALRDGFRKNSVEDFQPDRIANTIAFLDSARRFRGVEHKVLKNLVRVKAVQKQREMFAVRGLQFYRGAVRKDGEKSANAVFEKTLFWMNQSLGLCLR